MPSVFPELSVLFLYQGGAPIGTFYHFNVEAVKAKLEELKANSITLFDDYRIVRYAPQAHAASDAADAAVAADAAAYFAADAAYFAAAAADAAADAAYDHAKSLARSAELVRSVIAADKIEGNL